MKHFTLILLAFLFSAVSSTAEDENDLTSRRSKSKQGILEGIEHVSRTGNRYHAFLGVPYGKAPERFGLPQEADSWTGVKVADKMPTRCVHYCAWENGVVGTEDCLKLNIYTRNVKGKVPVMVKIHGGGFQWGTGNFLDAKYFMDEEVVLVTIQYRLGALGFLNTEDDVVTGNMGLRDQSFALKWIQENIANFGGDPEKVTIFGFSAGGASVHYQMLSPMSKGLISNGISLSGTALNPWALQTRPKALAQRLAKDLSCPTDTTEEMVECLRGKTAEEIVNAQINFSKHPHEFDLISMLFSPSVEKGKHEPKFISDTPYSIIVNEKTASKVPWIVGLCAEEGAFYTASILENPESLEKLNSDWLKMLPNILYFEDSASVPTQNKISAKVKDFYFPQGKITKEDYLKVGQVYGDRFFVNGISRTIKEYAKKPQFPVYPYIFNYTGTHSIVEGMLSSSRSYGIGHADDLKYLFNGAFMSPEYGLDTEEGKFSQKLVKLYVSFARDGKPTETWGPAKSWKPFNQHKSDSDSIPWYVIDKETKFLEKDVFQERTDFWESLPLRELEKVDWPEDKDEL